MAPVVNAEPPAGLGGLGAEDGLMKTEAVGQGGERFVFRQPAKIGGHRPPLQAI